uniref:Uncharacterized protein n=1 Tax=Psilocybe cubensis TaxID=181762 RepID=A0A8H7XSH5_PSICU
MSTAKGKQRETASGATQVNQALPPSSDTTTPPIASLKKKSRKKKVDVSSQPVDVAPPNPTDVPFDPKSILPNSKPHKSVARLREAHESAKKNSHSQSLTFSCIDGTVRTFDVQTSSYSVVEEKENHVISEPMSLDASTNPPPSTSRQQFEAFGIKAFRTKAIYNEVCFDFVSHKRWCPRGTACYRIHPLDRSTHRPTVVKAAASYNKMRSELQSSNTVGPSGHVYGPAPEISTSEDPAVRVKLPPTQITSGNSGPIAGPSRTSKSQNKTRGHEYKSNSAEDIRTPPWADHPPSDTSSSSNGTDNMEALLWFPQANTDDWEMDPEDYARCSESFRWLLDQPPSVIYTPSPSDPQPSASTQQSRQIHPLPPRPIVPEVSPSTVKHYRPKHGKPCYRWQRNECNLGFNCSYVHGDLKYDEDPASVAAPPRVPLTQVQPAAVLSNRVEQSPQELGAMSSKMPVVAQSPQRPQALQQASIPQIKHPRPKTNEICRRWQQKSCTYGYNCKRIHGDLKYDDDEEPLSRRPPEAFGFTLHDHMRIRVGPGFEVEDITTGFESRWVNVSNLPYLLPDPRLMTLMREFGEVLSIHRESQSPQARVQFSKPADAYKAYITLHGSVHFGRKLELRMAVETKVGGSRIDITGVRIDWEGPHRNVYMGYESMEVANEIVNKAKYIPYEDYVTQANVHIGVPAVGMVTVKFAGVPVNVTEEKMAELYGPHQGMVTERPNYKDFTAEDTIKGVRKLLNQPQFRGKVTNLEFRPPPYRDGKMRAWAHFNTPSDAKAAAEDIHDRKPIFTGHTRITARHIKTIEYDVHNEKYRRVASEIKALSDTIRKEGGGYSLNCNDKVYHVTLSLCGEDLQVLRRWKLEVERTLNGELILDNGAVAWHDFFGGPVGFSFLQEVERGILGVRLERDASRRTLRAFGIAEVRALARDKIVQKITALRSLNSYMIRMDGRLTYAFSSDGYAKLRETLGAENLVLDIWNRELRIHGNQDAFDIAMDAVAASRRRLELSDRGKKSMSSSAAVCPVCFHEPTNPVRLGCGHEWCRACIHRYLIASIDQKFFPLTCLGKEGKCTERIPLLTARTLLSAVELDSVVHAAFAAYIQSNSKEYHYCPTPDCSQVYRTAPEGVFIQCPSCLVRTCPSCHKDAHDGQTCAEVKSGDDLFKIWASKHDVKRCPGCSVPIEKDEGCNHMVCTMCKTHVCWVCMKTFPKGDGIYGHMQSQHGDWGLGPIV